MVTGPYLLDTNAVIWGASAPERLSALARKAVNTGPLVLSVVCFWEIVIKARKGSLEVADPVTWWARAVELLGGEILSVRATHVSALAGLPDFHRDPFDRMLIAQAAVEGLAVVSINEMLGRYTKKVVW